MNSCGNTSERKRNLLDDLLNLSDNKFVLPVDVFGCVFTSALTLQSLRYSRYLATFFRRDPFQNTLGVQTDEQTDIWIRMTQRDHPLCTFLTWILQKVAVIAKFKNILLADRALNTSSLSRSRTSISGQSRRLLSDAAPLPSPSHPPPSLSLAVFHIILSQNVSFSEIRRTRVIAYQR